MGYRLITGSDRRLLLAGGTHEQISVCHLGRAEGQIARHWLKKRLRFRSFLIRLFMFEGECTITM